MNRSQFLVPRLTRQQRREAIASPIHLAGASISNRLLDRLLNENVDTRDDLPVLQHAMMRTWAEWAKIAQGAIDISHYEKIGTIQSALSQHANEALVELTEAQQATAKILFQTITETDAGNRRIRRPCHLSEIVAISGTAPETLMEIIQKFRADGRSFLVLSSENPTDNPLIDLSHESLIRQWEMLATWVDQEAESAKIYRRLAESAELYLQGKAGLYREADLQVALDWQEKQKPSVVWAQRYQRDFSAALHFLEVSRHEAEMEAQKREQQRQERERLLQEKAELVQKQAEFTPNPRFCCCAFGVVHHSFIWSLVSNRTQPRGYPLKQGGRRACAASPKECRKCSHAKATRRFRKSEIGFSQKRCGAKCSQCSHAERTRRFGEKNIRFSSNRC
jgi:hypothetical protein